MAPKIKEKSLPLAIGLNLVLPGIGYIYMGKLWVGIIAVIIIVGVLVTAETASFGLTWLAMNIIMLIDMLILHKKNAKELVKQNMKKCPHCAEMIQKEAKICRFCNSNLD